MIQIKIEGLTKKYDKNVVFENFNEILESDSYVFLKGENGSGKTTFINCLLSLVSYEGIIVKDDLLFSYTPEKISLPDYMTVSNFLYLIALNKKKMPSQIKEEIRTYLEKFEILEYEKAYFYKLSKGTKQKILLIQNLMSDSDVHIFDEPLSGLDEKSRKVFVSELRNIKKKNKLIIISTHHLDEYNYKKKKIINFPQGDFLNVKNVKADETT